MELDNPVYHALAGPHSRFAEALGDALGYPSAVAPFVAIPSADVVPDFAAAGGRGSESAYFLGVLPNALPDGWHYVSRSRILSMTLASNDPPETHEHDIRVLGVADGPGMLTLARIAFPEYFRPRTAELGEYLGIFAGEQLVAMAGERMALDGLQEISGVCTHPVFAGRGSARRLTGALMRRHRQRSVASFLHVSDSNVVARRLYESMGFTVRASLPLGKVERTRTSS